MSPEEKAREIVLRIIYDLTDRRGLRQEWDNIDEDIKDEIMAKWEAEALDVIRQGSGA